MDLVSKYQGYVERVLRNDNSDSSQDSYIERLLDRISNGVLAEDRRNAMAELQSVVTESHYAQLAFGARGFQVLLKVLKEEREDVETVRGALETIVCALTPLDHTQASKNEIQPALMNSDLLSSEIDNISLLLSLLSEEDFYVRYFTLQILTALLNNSPNRLQEAILTIPRGITGLMDMLMDREAIRNEALLLLTYLTREAEEIQKIVVFEGAFEKIFSIIKEEGGSDGGIVVQDCLELLNNLLRHNASNQVLLRETIGFDHLLPILRLRGSTYKFNQQKTINILSALETIRLLIMGGPEADPGKDSNSLTNKTVLVQKKVLEYLLMLGVESQRAPVAVRCAALQCIGDLINGHPKNRDFFASMALGEEPNVEPALNSILRIILRSSNSLEFMAADYVFKCFCEKNPDGQTVLASTLTPQPQAMNHAPFEDDIHMSFGSMLLHGLTMSENDGDLETCCRAASVLSHVLKDNAQCKERVLSIELDAPMPSFGGSEPLLHRMVKYLALSSNKDGKSNGVGISYVQLIILKLLIIWIYDCPTAVQCFLDSRPHLTYLLDLVSNPNTTTIVRGLTAVLLGECVVHNKSSENGKDASSVADLIAQKVGLTAYFSKFEDMYKSLPSGSVNPFLFSRQLTRSTAASLAEIEDVDKDGTDLDRPIVLYTFGNEFIDFLKNLESMIRDKIVDVYSHPKGQVAALPVELEQRQGESDGDYIKRMKPFIQKQCLEMQELLNRNATLVGEMSRTGGNGSSSHLERRSSTGSENLQLEALRRDLQDCNQRLEMLRAEKAKVESEALDYQNLAAKTESDLKSLSDAYNSLEQTNFHLEKEIKSMRNSGNISMMPDVEALKEEAREEAQKESEAELNDLLVCLGQEQSRVEKLSLRLMELGEDVDKLLEGVGDESAVPGGDDDDDDDDE